MKCIVSQISEGKHYMYSTHGYLGGGGGGGGFKGVKKKIGGGGGGGDCPLSFVEMSEMQMKITLKMDPRLCNHQRETNSSRLYQ